MFDAKNLSPKKLAAFTSAVVSIPVSIGIFILEKNLLIAAYALIIIFFGSFALIHYIFQKFIYRKIKLIYKFIHQTKATRQQEMFYNYVLPKKSIDQVRADVEAWAIQKRKEVELLQQNELFRKEFLQNLAHEFKTPVFAVQGYIDSLLNGAMDNAELNRKFLESAAKNTERLVNLLNDLDAISRFERGELKIEKSYFNIQGLALEAFETLAMKAEKHHIQFNIKKGCEKPIIVFADKEKIRQVLSNLIDNSIKYGKEGGQIIASFYNTDDKNMLVEISDNGMGISSSHVDRIFERFYRTDAARTKDRKGSGLGLSICKHIIEAHEQIIHVRSKENIGTTVGFTLEVKEKEDYFFQ